MGLRQQTLFIALAFAFAVAGKGNAMAQEASPAASPVQGESLASTPGDSLRGARYCELLVPEPGANGSGLVMRVFNTQGLNDCPDAAWQAIDAREQARHLGVPMIIKNGPRYLAYDHISAEIDGSLETFGDLEMRVVATTTWPAGVQPQDRQPYADMVVDRTTEYVYEAGKPVFQLVAPDGSVYVMQTYVAENDPAGDQSGLENLAGKLALPDGWEFRVVVPDADVHAATSDGKATVLRDDLGNTYQLLARG